MEGKMIEPVPKNPTPERSDVATHTEKQLRALATIYKVLERQQEVLDKILVQQEAQTNWLIHIGEADSDRKPVTVEDFNMPFMALVGFLVKAALASIPAAIVLYAVFFALIIAFGLLAAMLGLSIPSPF